jgi:cAMP-dependent protein kinase regulator
MREGGARGTELPGDLGQILPSQESGVPGFVFLSRWLSEGKYEKELKELRQKCRQEPKNLRLLVRTGDLLEKMGKRGEALESYRQASERYARNGFLIEAIAVNKVILRLDPAQSQIHDHLAELYAERGMIIEERMGRQTGEGIPAAESEEARPVIPLFSDLQKEELSRVMEKIQAKQFGLGAVICQEGEPGDSLFIISQGKVGIFRHHGREERIRLNELRAGDFFGEFGFFADARRRATVEALADTTVLEITKQDLQEIIQEFPGVSQVLFKFYKERVLDTLLVTSSLFRSFSPGERKQILSKFTIEKFPVGAMVLQEGDSGDSLYIIKKGEVEVFTFTSRGEMVKLARLKEGDFFGEISLLTGRPRTASVKVLQPAELVRLAKVDFDAITANHPEVTKILEESLHLRLGDKLQALGVFQSSSAKEGMV